jgi:hypothetical protein
MSKRMLYMPVTAVLAAGAAALSGAACNTASAMPLAGSFSLGGTAGTDVLPVWWYREWNSGSSPAFEVEAPPSYYRPYPRYRYYTYYDAPRTYYDAPRRRAYDYDDDDDDGYAYDRYYDRYPAPRYRSSAAAYCASRYRSWDPESGTFIGYDGLTHRCP